MHPNATDGTPMTQLQHIMLDAMRDMYTFGAASQDSSERVFAWSIAKSLASILIALEKDLTKENRSVA